MIVISNTEPIAPSINSGRALSLVEGYAQSLAPQRPFKAFKRFEEIKLFKARA